MDNFNNSIYFTSRISYNVKYYLFQKGVTNDQLPHTVISKQGLIDHLSSQGLMMHLF